jgi:hypothetical protein
MSARRETMLPGMNDTGPTTYAVYKLWNEAEFRYTEYVMHCSRSGIEPEVLHDPPLSILLQVRKM